MTLKKMLGYAQGIYDKVRDANLLFAMSTFVIWAIRISAIFSEGDT